MIVAHERLRVLVVDDEQSNRVVLERALTQAGFQVATAASVREARGCLVEAGYDLMLLGVRLKDQSELAFIPEVLGVPDPPDVVVIAAPESEDLALKDMKSGAPDVLTRPLAPERLTGLAEKLSRRPRPDSSARMTPGSFAAPLPGAGMTPGSFPEPLPGGRDASLEELVESRLRTFLERMDGRFPEDLRAVVMSRVERSLLRVVLEVVGGNQLEAARVLGMNRNTLRKRLRELDVPTPAKRRNRRRR